MPPVWWHETLYVGILPLPNPSKWTIHNPRLQVWHIHLATCLGCISDWVKFLWFLCRFKIRWKFVACESIGVLLLPLSSQSLDNGQDLLWYLHCFSEWKLNQQWLQSSILGFSKFLYIVVTSSSLAVTLSLIWKFFPRSASIHPQDRWQFWPYHRRYVTDQRMWISHFVAAFSFCRAWSV